jgi:serine/threonine protein kinase
MHNPVEKDLRKLTESSEARTTIPGRRDFGSLGNNDDTVIAPKKKSVDRQPAKMEASKGGGPRRQQVHELIKEVLAADELYAPSTELSLERKEKLGEGGMGVIYRVHDRRLGRPAAIKYLLSSSERSRERFLREAEITAKLDHPGVPSVYEMGTTVAGEHYLLMAVIEGKTLRQAFKEYFKGGQRKACLDALLEVLCRVGEAIAYAHSQGVIHRDLKPANIMLGEFGEVLVMDWGLAKELAVPELSVDDAAVGAGTGKGLVTLDGSLLGTPGYMAPEQAACKPACERSDVFALGVMLCEILTGKSAIEGHDLKSRVFNTVIGEIALPRQRRGNVPEELNWLAEQSLAFNASDRPEAAVFVSQLRAYLAGQELDGYPYSLSERSIRRVKKHPGTFLGVLVGLLLVVLLGLVKASYDELQKEKLVAEAMRYKQDGGGRNADKATESFSKMIARDPENASHYYIRGQTYREEGETAYVGGLKEKSRKFFEAALNDFEKVVKLGALKKIEDPNSPVKGYFYFLRGWTRARLGNRKQGAIDDLSKYIALNLNVKGQSSLWLSYDFRGMVQLELGHYKEAIEDFSKVIELNPTDFGYRHRGMAYFEKRDDKAAIRDFDEGIKKYLNTHYRKQLAEFYSRRGQCKRRQGDRKGALADFSQAINEYFMGDVFYSQRGLTQFELGDYKAAIKDLSQVISMCSKYSEEQRRAEKKERREKKIGYEQRARDSKTLDTQFRLRLAAGYFHRGNVRSRLGEKEDALSDYTEAVKINPELQQVYFNRGLLRLQLGKYKGAREDFNRAQTLNPQSPGSPNIRGKASTKSGDKKGALEDCSHAIGINPQHAEAYGFRAFLHHSLGNKRAAIKDLKRFLELAPDHQFAPDVRAKLSEIVGESSKN